MKFSNPKRKFFLIVLLILGVLRLNAQSGPGGIGDGTGTNGPRNVLWLDASTLGLANDASVTSWTDQSGNGNDLAQQGADLVPTFRNDGLSGTHDIVRFDGTERYLVIGDNASLDGYTEGMCVFIVANFTTVDDNPRGIISKRNSSTDQPSYSLFTYTGSDLNFDVYTPSNDRLQGGTALIASTDYIMSTLYDGSNQYINIQSENAGDHVKTGRVRDTTSDLIIGALDDDYGTYLDADIAEVIIYGEDLTQAERIVVENYLSLKYGISIVASGNDHWDETTYAAYVNDLAGIGQESATNSEATTAASGFLRISESADMDDDDWLFWGNNDGDIATYTTTEVVTGTSQQRLAREWVINETNDLGNVTISLAADDLPSTGVPSPEFYLLVDTDGDADFANASSNFMTLNGDSYEVTLDLSDGDHLAVAFVTPNPAGAVGTLAFWFNSDFGPQNSSAAATDGDLVDEWLDLSANGSDAITAGNNPVFDTDNTLNFHPLVSFDGTDDYLTFDMTALQGADYTIMSVVQRKSGAANQMVLGSEDNALDAMSLGYSTDTQVDARNSSTALTNSSVSAFDSPVESPAIVALDYNSVNLTLEEYRNGGRTSTNVATAVDYATTGYTGNLGRALAANYFDGDIVELFAFSSNLSTDDYNAARSNLAIKYGIDIGQDYTDDLAATLWDLSDNGTYINDVTAIGYDASFGLDQRVSKNATDSIVLATSSDFTSLNSDGSRSQLSDGQYAFISNDDDAFTMDQELNGVANSRSNRTWLYREVGAPGSVVIAIPTSLISVNQLLVSTDPTFAAGVTSVGLATSGDYSFATYDFSDGDYFTFADDASEIWYSYLSGDWNNPSNWTLDGAISAGYVNPNSKYPTAGDSVVINSGRTITANIDNIVVNKLEILGTIDLGATTGQNFSYIEGSGTMRLSGAGGLDNYPSGVDTLFYDNTEGGSVEYYGTGFTFDQTRRYNNLTLNLDNSTDVATMTGDSIYVYGNFNVNQGFFQVNDNAATNNLAIAVNGDLTITANGGIDVGTANARHELNLSGDFTNQGDVDFTNRTSQTTGSEATDGIVDVNFVSPDQDQTADLQNTTDFYRIEVNKGVDDTYVVEIVADDPSYFNLYGYAAESTNSAQGTTNNNACGLIYGTLKVGNNVTISPLNAGGNYSIYEGAQIWVNGGTVEKTSGTAIVPYGKIRVSSGLLNAPINSGVTTRNNGQLTIEGGTVTLNQFRTSIEGVTAQGGLVMSGGIMNVTGVNTSTNYYTFSLTYEGNVFNMTGGTINMSGASTKGGIYINSSDENISVTGGTVNLDVTNANDLTVTSRAPFFNLNVLRSNVAGTGAVMISSGSSGDGAGETTLTPDGLTILNDLTIDNSDGFSTEFDANGMDLTITGSILIENGSVVDLLGMELSFIGAGSSSLDIQSGATLQLDSLILTKNFSTTTLEIDNGASTALQIDGLLQINKGRFDIGAFDITVNGALDLSDTIGTVTNTGLLYMNGGSAQTINSDDGFVFDMEIDNPNGVSLSGDFSVDLLTMDGGVFDIGTSKLSSNNEIQTSGVFGSTLMVQVDGNDSDGGLEYFFDADETLVYPIGTDANGIVRYTPATVTLDASADNGSITLNPVDLELSLLDQTIANDALTYYWKSVNSGFSGSRTVDYLFTFSNLSSDVPSGDTPVSEYIPGWVEGTTRVADPVNGVAGEGMTATTVTTSSHTLVSAKYTAATPAKFVGTVRTVYAIRDGEWHDPGTWSDAADGTAFTLESELPGPGDIVQIGDSNENFAVAICNGTDDDCSNIYYNPITVSQVSILRRQNGESSILTIDETASSHNLGIVTNREPGVSGESADASKFAISGPNLPEGDFGEFNSAPNTIFAYSLIFPATVTGARNVTKYGGGTVAKQTVDPFTMGNTITEYSNLQFESSGGTGSDAITFPDIDINIAGELRFFRSTGFETVVNFNSTGTTVTVGEDITVNSDDAIIEFPAVGDPSTLVVIGDINFRSNNNISIQAENNAGLLNHKIQLQGDILSPSGTSFLTFYRDASSPTIDLEFIGETNSSFASFTNVPELNNLIINKGSDTTYHVEVLSDINLNGSNISSPQALELQNGKLILNNEDINLEMTNGVDFTIPSTAGLEVTLGTVTSTAADIILNGLLRVNGGTVDLASTDIEYSNTGSAIIEVSSGTLEVGGQVRRATTSTSGVLKYRQTGGDVDIATDGATTSSRAAFEVLNTGSEFTLTGGTFNIERGVAGDANESLELDPDTYDVTGSTITVFENLGADYGSNYFNIKSSISLNNLTIANSMDLPDARAYVQPLTVNDLVINTNQAFLNNNLDLTVLGDFNNEGTYTNTNSITVFGGTNDHTISGSGTYTIYNLTKSGAGTATLDLSLDLDNDLRVLSGTLDMGSNTISLQNDAYIESTLANSTGNGLIFNGTTGQDLYGLASSTVTLGTITISNASGIDIPDGNGYNFDLTQNLRLAGGVFNIGGSLVTMKEGSTITDVSPFSVNNMVQTNSSFTDNGFVVEFFAVAADTTIFYPVGELKYTPVSFDISAGATAGNIRVRPANEIHPTITNNDETALMPAQTEIDDTQNILNYYWVVVAEGTTGVQGSATFYYDHADIVAAESDTSNFISGRILSNESTWEKYLPTQFIGGSQLFRVPLDIGAGVTAAEITGDYTAGLGSTDGLTNDIEGSLPDELAEYETDFAGTGNYSSAVNWNPLNGSPAVSDGVGPVGAQVIVRDGDDLTLDVSNIRLYSTEIEAGGILRVPAGVTGIRLGNVSGTGTIVLNDTELMPTGEYSSFFACDGGAIQYSGTTDYSVLSGVSQIRAVTFEGSGTRTMPNNNLSVCDVLVINGPTVAFNSGRTRTIGDDDTETDGLDIQAGVVTLTNATVLDITGDFLLSGGSFTGQSGTSIEITDDVNFSAGTLNWNNSDVTLNGTTEQIIDGSFTGAAGFEDVLVNNTSTTGVTLNSGAIEVNGTITLTDGLVNTSSSETLTITSTGAWVGATSASYVTGPITKQTVAVASTYEFPVGKSARYAPVSIVNVNVGADDWTAEYFTSMGAYSNATFDNADPGSGFNALIRVESTDRWTVSSAGLNQSEVRASYDSHNNFVNSDHIRLVWWDDEASRDGDAAQNRWENQGGQVSGTAASGTITSEASVFFSERQFGLGYAPESVLPVDLVSFTGTAENDEIALQWVTASELNNDFFDVMHSLDGEYFESIGIVEGNGTVNELMTYQLIDHAPSPGINYYQLRQVDYDGTEEYHDIISVSNDYRGANVEFDFFPNPTSAHNMNVRFATGDDHTPMLITLISLTGEIAYKEEIEVNALNFETKLEPTRSLSTGFYILYIKQGSNSSYKRVVIE